jgi:hypothetical protein
MELHTISVDLGKTVFHLVALNLRGEVRLLDYSLGGRKFCYNSILSSCNICDSANGKSG